MEQISGADLLAIRSQGAMAYDYATTCRENTDRLTAAYLALQVKNVRLQTENEKLEAALHEIHSYAHERSTGPAVEDALWEVRRMAYELLTPNTEVKGDNT